MVTWYLDVRQTSRFRDENLFCCGLEKVPQNESFSKFVFGRMLVVFRVTRSWYKK